MASGLESQILRVPNEERWCIANEDSGLALEIYARPSVQQELKEKIRSRDRVIGLFLLAVLVTLLLPVFYYLYPTINSPPRRNYILPNQFWVLVPTAVLLGASIGYAVLAAIWFAFSDDSLLRRFQFLFFLSLIAWGAWFLGYTSQMDESVPVRPLQQEPIIASAVYPVFLLGILLPLVWFRSLFGRAFTSVWEDVPRRQSLSVLDLILWTTFLATVGGGFRIATIVFTSSSEAFVPVAIGFSVCFGVSLALVLPCAILLCSKRISFIVASVSLVLTIALLATLIGYRLMQEDGLLMTFGAVSASLICVLGCSAIRFFGLRLQYQSKRVSGSVGEGQ